MLDWQVLRTHKFYLLGEGGGEAIKKKKKEGPERKYMYPLLCAIDEIDLGKRKVLCVDNDPAAHIRRILQRLCARALAAEVTECRHPPLAEDLLCRLHHLNKTQRKR